MSTYRPRGMTARQVIEHYSQRQDNGCVYWTGTIEGRSGYGIVRFNNVNFRAHRISWSLVHGEIPAGKILDHQCHNESARLGFCFGGPSCMHRRCVNPEHLALSTHVDNIKASPLTTGSIHAAKTNCPKGHKYSGDNLYVEIPTDGHAPGRQCRACKKEAMNRYWTKRGKPWRSL